MGLPPHATTIALGVLACSLVAVGQSPCDLSVTPLCSASSFCTSKGATGAGDYECRCKSGFSGAPSRDGRGCIRPAITADITSKLSGGLELQVGSGADVYVVAGVPDSPDAVRTSMLTLERGMRRLLGESYASNQDLGSSGGIVDALSDLADNSRRERAQLKLDLQSVIEDEVRPVRVIVDANSNAVQDEKERALAAEALVLAQAKEFVGSKATKQMVVDLLRCVNDPFFVLDPETFACSAPGPDVVGFSGYVPKDTELIATGAWVKVSQFAFDQAGQFSPTGMVLRPDGGMQIRKSGVYFFSATVTVKASATPVDVAIAANGVVDTTLPTATLARTFAGSESVLITAQLMLRPGDVVHLMVLARQNVVLSKGSGYSGVWTGPSTVAGVSAMLTTDFDATSTLPSEGHKLSGFATSGGSLYDNSFTFDGQQFLVVESGKYLVSATVALKTINSGYVRVLLVLDGRATSAGNPLEVWSEMVGRGSQAETISVSVVLDLKEGVGLGLQVTTSTSKTTVVGKGSRFSVSLLPAETAGPVGYAAERLTRINCRARTVCRNKGDSTNTVFAGLHASPIYNEASGVLTVNVPGVYLLTFNGETLYQCIGTLYYGFSINTKVAIVDGMYASTSRICGSVRYKPLTMTRVVSLQAGDTVQFTMWGINEARSSWYLGTTGGSSATLISAF